MDLLSVLGIITLPLVVLGLFAALMIQLSRSEVLKARAIAVAPWFYLGGAAVGVPKLVRVAADPSQGVGSVLDAAFLPISFVAIAVYFFRTRWKDGSSPAA